MVVVVAKRTHHPRKRARWLISEGDRVLEEEKNPPSSKTSWYLVFEGDRCWYYTSKIIENADL